MLLKQMLFNLMENAVKYSPENSQINVDLIDEDSALQFSIKDNGPGIPEEEKTRIFDRFYRGKVTTPKTQGTGLGLSIAKSIAELHQGTITVSDRYPRGSQFNVTLPKHSI